MLAVWLALLSAVLWGLLWIPARWLETQGLHGLWAGTAMNAGALAALGLWLTVRRGWEPLPMRTVAGVGLVGTALACYTAALNYSDVVRVVLLFYLAPIWSKIIETVFLGIPWTRSATLALGLGLAGAVLILGADLTTIRILPGDGLALFAGLAWAAGAALVFADHRSGTATPAALTAGAGVALSLVFLPFETLPGAGPGIGAAGMAIGAVYTLPLLLLTIWTARRLPPATLTFLLTAEIVVGVASSAIFLDEPYGPPQMIGTVLILAGATIEVTQSLARGGKT